MTVTDAERVVRKLAREDGYEGKLTDRAIEEMAKVYVESCDENGDPKVRVFWRSPVNHRSSNLTKTQWLLTKTPSFRAWFGKSVVVDENGEPKVMYHGSAKEFEEFKPAAISLQKSMMTLWSGPGFYFTDRKRVAIIYGKNGGTVKDVFLRLEHPLVVDETGNAEKWSEHITRAEAEKILLDGDNTQWLDHTLCAVLARMDGGGGKARYRDMTRKDRVAEYVRRLKTDVVKLKVASEAYGAKSQKLLLESICRHTGHDGVIHTVAPEVVEYIVYNPTSIKSASGNDGGFDRRSSVTTDETVESEANERHNLSDKRKGVTTMALKNLIDVFGSLKAKTMQTRSTCGMDEAVESLRKFAEDIVDRHGRHHEMKGVPPGGQYMEEGQFLSGHASIQHAINAVANGKRAEHLRRNLAPAYARIMANDSTTRAKIQRMRQDLQGMSKHTLTRKMAEHLNDMLKHTDSYEEVKDMNREQFSAWLQQHPEYNTGIVQKLMGRGYRGERTMIGANGERVGQGHEAWEEAKWAVGARAVTSAIMFRECAAARNHEPEQIMAHEIERAMENPAPQENIERREEAPRVENAAAGAGSAAGGTPRVDMSTMSGQYTDRDGVQHQIVHNEGGLKATLHPTEIGAVQAEMRQAFADAGNDVEGAEEYAHALSHFLGRGNDERSPHPGMRAEGVMKHQLAEKMERRLADKKRDYEDNLREFGPAFGETILSRQDLEATQKAVAKIASVCGISQYDLPEGENYANTRDVLARMGGTNTAAPATTELPERTPEEPVPNGGHAENESAERAALHDNLAAAMGATNIGGGNGGRGETLNGANGTNRMTMTGGNSGGVPVGGGSVGSNMGWPSAGGNGNANAATTASAQTTVAAPENANANANAAPRQSNNEIHANVRSALDRLLNHWGQAHSDRILRGINDAMNGTRNADVDNYLNEAEQVLGANDPVMQAIRNRVNGGTAAQPQNQAQQNAARPAAAAAPQNAPAAPAPAAPGSSAANGQQTNANAAPATPTVAPFSHTGSLPANHQIRNANINRQMVQARTHGMPVNITNARQVTPQNLADIFGRLPKRRVFDHRNGDVTIPGVGRMDGFTALRTMVAEPNSQIGREMRSRLARADQSNPWVRRLGQAMDALHGTPSAASAAHGSNADFRPVVTRTFGNDHIYSVPDDIAAQDRKVAQDKGFGSRNSPTRFHGRAMGCNCYRNDAALFLQSRGYDVTPRRAPYNNQQEFAKEKLAMFKAYERVNGNNRNETLQNLERMRTTYPNGTWISMWSGGHNTSLRLQDGQWYFLSGWDDETSARGRRVSSADIINRITHPPKKMGTSEDENILQLAGLGSDMSYIRSIASRRGISNDDFERFRRGKATPAEINSWRSRNANVSQFLDAAKSFRALKGEARKALHRKGNMHPTDAEVLAEMNREPIYWRANSSYVIKPTDPIIPELFDQVE